MDEAIREWTLAGGSSSAAWMVMPLDKAGSELIPYRLIAM